MIFIPPQGQINGRPDEYGNYRGLIYPEQIVHYFYPITQAPIIPSPIPPAPPSTLSLFDEVYKRTSMIGKYAFTKEGANLLDLIALSPDEYDTFYQFCREAANEVFSVVYPYMNKNVESFFFDTSLEYPNSVHYIIYKPSWVDDNALKSTDAALMDVLCTYIIHRWFMLIGDIDRGGIFLRDYYSKVDGLRMLLSQHNKMSIVSHPM